MTPPASYDVETKTNAARRVRNCVSVCECVDELRGAYVYFVRSLLLQLHSLQLLQLVQLLLLLLLLVLLLLLLSLHKLLKPHCGTWRVSSSAERKRLKSCCAPCGMLRFIAVDCCSLFLLLSLSCFSSFFFSCCCCCCWQNNFEKFCSCVCYRKYIKLKLSTCFC